jgi:hypothetical protein
MDVWMSRAKKALKCTFCPEPFETGDAIVITKLKVTNSRGTFTTVRRWHPQCWINQGLIYLEKHPTVDKPTGRPKLELDPEVKAERMKLLRRHAQLMHFHRMAQDKGDILGAVNYYIRACELMPMMEECGGVPRSWYAIPEVATSA